MAIHSVTTAAPRTARVLDAALGVLTERTYGGATAPQVAERAAIGLATIYRSFPGEGALANVVFRRAKRDLLDRLRSAVAALAADAGAHARVPAVSQGQAAFAAADPAGFAYLEHQQHASYLDAQSQALCARVESVAVEVVRAGQASVVSAFLDSAVDSVEIADGPFAGFNRDLVDRYRKA